MVRGHLELERAVVADDHAREAEARAQRVLQQVAVRAVGRVRGAVHARVRAHDLRDVRLLHERAELRQVRVEHVVLRDVRDELEARRGHVLRAVVHSVVLATEIKSCGGGVGEKGLLLHRGARHTTREACIQPTPRAPAARTTRRS